MTIEELAAMDAAQQEIARMKTQITTQEALIRRLREDDNKRAESIREAVKELGIGAEYWAPLDAVKHAVKEPAKLRAELQRVYAVNAENSRLYQEAQKQIATLTAERDEARATRDRSRRAFLHHSEFPIRKWQGVIHKRLVCAKCHCSQTLPADIQVCNCQCHIEDRAVHAIPSTEGEPNIDRSRQEHEEQRKLLSAWKTVAMDLYEALPDEIDEARKQFVDLAENGEIPASRKNFEEMLRLLEDAARTTEPQAIAFAHRTMDSANYLHVPELTLAMVREVAALHGRIAAALDPSCAKCCKPKSMHRAEVGAHHSECTLEEFVKEVK